MNLKIWTVASPLLTKWLLYHVFTFRLRFIYECQINRPAWRTEVNFFPLWFLNSEKLWSSDINNIFTNRLTMVYVKKGVEGQGGRGRPTRGCLVASSTDQWRACTCEPVHPASNTVSLSFLTFHTRNSPLSLPRLPYIPHLGLSLPLETCRKAKTGLKLA